MTVVESLILFCPTYYTIDDACLILVGWEGGRCALLFSEREPSLTPGNYLGHRRRRSQTQKDISDLMQADTTRQRKAKAKPLILLCLLLSVRNENNYYFFLVVRCGRLMARWKAENQTSSMVLSKRHGSVFSWQESRSPAMSLNGGSITFLRFLR